MALYPPTRIAESTRSLPEPKGIRIAVKIETAESLADSNSLCF
jgi:hypothetical protein